MWSDITITLKFPRVERLSDTTLSDSHPARTLLCFWLFLRPFLTRSAILQLIQRLILSVHSRSSIVVVRVYLYSSG